MLLREKIKQTHFSDAEQSIIDLLLDQPEQIANLTIQETAKLVYSHPSTFIRVAKKMGYSGWADFKSDYLDEYHYLNSKLSSIDSNLPFLANDGLMTIANKIAHLEWDTIQDTLSLLNHDTLQKAKQILVKARQITIFTSTTNAVIAEDFSLRMNRIGKQVSIVQTTGEHTYRASSCSADSCAILISYSGENAAVLQTMQILKKRKIPILALTSIGDNTLSQGVDCVLSITTRERLYSKIGSYVTTTSIVYLLNVLYSLIFSDGYQEHLSLLIQVGQLYDNRKGLPSILGEDDKE